VDQRREPRLKPNQTATVKVLGMVPGPTLETFVVELSGSGMRLRSRLPVPCGASIEVRINHTVTSGSVVRCEPENGGYNLGIQVTETAPAPQS
jgi:hypothetical protein